MMQPTAQATQHLSICLVSTGHLFLFPRRSIMTEGKRMILARLLLLAQSILLMIYLRCSMLENTA